MFIIQVQIRKKNIAKESVKGRKVSVKFKACINQTIYISLLSGAYLDFQVPLRKKLINVKDNDKRFHLCP